MRKVIQLIAISFIYYEQNDKIAWKRVNRIEWHKKASKYSTYNYDMLLVS